MASHILKRIMHTTIHMQVLSNKVGVSLMRCSSNPSGHPTSFCNLSIKHHCLTTKVASFPLGPTIPLSHGMGSLWRRSARNFDLFIRSKFLPMMMMMMTMKVMMMMKVVVLVMMMVAVGVEVVVVRLILSKYIIIYFFQLYD